MTNNDSSGPSEAAAAGVDPLLLELLVCPQTKKTLVYNEESQELVSPAAGLAYPIRDGVPIMLVDEARELDDSERAKFKAN